MKTYKSVSESHDTPQLGAFLRYAIRHFGLTQKEVRTMAHLGSTSFTRGLFGQMPTAVYKSA